MKLEAVATILLMALVTAITRTSGLWLIGRIKMSPFVERWLEHLPGALILAIITPSILTGSLTEAVAAFLVVVTMLATRNFMLSLAVGLGTVCIGRNIF